MAVRFPSIPDDAPDFCRSSQLASWLMVSRRTVAELVERGTLPKPYALGPKLHFFNTNEVRAALAAHFGRTAVPVEPPPSPQPTAPPENPSAVCPQGEVEVGPRVDSAVGRSLE